MEICKAYYNRPILHIGKDFRPSEKQLEFLKLPGNKKVGIFKRQEGKTRLIIEMTKELYIRDRKKILIVVPGATQISMIQRIIRNETIEHIKFNRDIDTMIFRNWNHDTDSLRGKRGNHYNYIFCDDFIYYIDSVKELMKCFDSKFILLSSLEFSQSKEKEIKGKLYNLKKQVDTFYIKTDGNTI